MIQNIEFVIGLQCKTCKKFYSLSEKSKLINHKNGESTIKTNAFHETKCNCKIKQMESERK